MNERANLEAELISLEKRTTLLRRRIAPFQEKLMEACERQRAVQERLGEIKAQETALNDWPTLLERTTDSMAMHRLREKAFMDLGLWGNGYSEETGQHAFRVMLTYGDPASLARTLAAVETLAPYMRPRKDGRHLISVFEHTLSYSGSYYIELAGDFSEAKLLFTTGSYRRPMTTGSLAEVLAYVQKHHWYDGRDGDDDE